MSPAIGAAPFVRSTPRGSVRETPAHPHGGSSRPGACRYLVHEPRRPARRSRRRRRHRPRARRAAAPGAQPSTRSRSRTCTSTRSRRPRSLCAALAVALGVLGVRRHDRRTAAIGAGFTVMASLLAVHGLTTPGFLIEAEYTAAVGVSGALAVPLGGAVLLAALLSRPRELGLRARPRGAADRRRGRRASRSAALALLAPGCDPEHPCRPAPARVVDRRRERADLRRARAARTADVPAHAPPRRPGRGGRARVARHRSRDLPAQPGLVGRLLERARARAGRLPGHHGRARERSRTCHALARAALRDRRPRRRDRAGGAARRMGRAPAGPSGGQGRLDARAHAPRRAARRRGRAGARSARARACAAWPSRRCCTTSASCRCRTRSSPRPAR